MSELPTALALDVDDAVWTVRDRFDPAAVALADRHYSREKKGSPQVGGPGYLLVLVTPDERACWISKRHSPATTSPRVLKDGLDVKVFRCSLFRNESPALSSDLIRAAVALTEERWGRSWPFGWATYVDRTAVRSANPGYCFLRAGWRRDRGWDEERPGSPLVRLLYNPMPEGYR